MRYLVFAIAMLAGGAVAQSAGTDQREAAVRLAASYPANPLDASLDREASAVAAALQTAPETPATCSDLPWIEKKKYKYAHELSVAYVLGSGAYSVQHAEIKPVRRYYPALMAASQAALRAYQVILEHDPKGRLDGMNVWNDQMQSGEFQYALLKKCEAPNPALSRSKGPVTADERQRIIALAEDMQKDPLDISLRAEYQELFVVVIQASDLTVHICSASSPWMGDKPDYKYGPDLLAMNTMAMASWVLRNPVTDKTGFPDGRAGLTASLRGYEAILKQHPDVRSKSLDAALAAEKDGKLDDWYKGQFAAQCVKK